MALESTLRKVIDQPEASYRQAPHNVEAEQALLGAILVNNEAFYRVSDFLEPKHFFEPIHAKIYEVAAGIVRAGKIATPVTLKTFLPPDADIAGAGLSPAQYLARLAAEATTVINAEDYGRTIYDLAIRRNLIIIFLSTEIMFQGIVMTAAAFAKFHVHLQGQAFALFLLVIAAVEAGLALGMIMLLYRRRGTLDADVWSVMHG